MSKKIKFIVLEGNDGSGKSTQFKLLKAKLEESDEKVESIKFPQHGETFFGKMVDDYLNGEFGDATKVPAKLASAIYAADRWQAKDQLNKWLESGSIILADRYMSANKGHQLSKLESEEEKLAMLNWLDKMEYEVYGIPRPDLVIYFNMPIKFNLLNDREAGGKEYIDGELDNHENDPEYLGKTNEAFLFTAKHYEYWKVIDCVKDNKRLPPDEIHELVWKVLKKN